MYSAGKQPTSTALRNLITWSWAVLINYFYFLALFGKMKRSTKQKRCNLNHHITVFLVSLQFLLIASLTNKQREYCNRSGGDRCRVKSIFHFHRNLNVYLFFFRFDFLWTAKLVTCLHQFDNFAMFAVHVTLPARRLNIPTVLSLHQ